MTVGHPHLAGPHLYPGTPPAAVSATGYLPSASAGTLSPPAPGATLSPPFFLLEMQTYRPGSPAQAFDYGHLSRPLGAVSKLPQTIEYTGQIVASDVGYVGPAVYPPTLDTAFEMDLETSLDPHSSAGGYQFGSIKINNADRSLDSVAATQNNDGRPLRVLMGQKTLDLNRGIFLDPPYSNMVPVLGGIGQPWSLDDTVLTCPVRDPTYWIEGSVQNTLYGGTGGYDGNATLKGLPKPKARGGTAANPIQNVTPVQIDPVSLVYQYSDGPGTVLRIYEGAYTGGIVGTGDAADLYDGHPPASGYYRTCNARGCFQLGSKPVQAITADVTGAFPSAGTVTTLFGIARYLLTEDMGLPVSLLDMGGFIGADAAFPYVAGIYIGDQVQDGATTLAGLLASIGAQVVPTVAGQLRPFILRSLPSTVRAVLSLDMSNAISVTPAALPAKLYPPTYRWRVGYGHNYTVQTSGLLPGAAAAHVQQISQEDQFATWASTAVLAAWKRPNDPATLPGALLSITDAQAVANALGALWGVRRRTYDVAMPILTGVGRQIGDVVSIAWPMDDLAAGRLGQIVNLAFRSYDAIITARVLI